MNINANSMHNDMQRMISNAQMNVPKLGSTGLDASSSVAPAAGSDFSAMLKSAIDTVNNIQKTAGKMKTAVEMGDRSVSLADAMIASEKASVAFSATVEIRNKFVEAYKEIMNMPV
ncbi:MAG: flagellar hook-basal body complex protein FliE [Psychrobium sp.]|nr:flagellar hook-basal body complex protein FliE [Psychrobium sp.]